jgi:Rrf2 family iron-sulfur cluster assembly transcriptional regulator
MRLSSQEEYGLRCLLHVANHAAAGPVSITGIASAEGLSVEYVGKIMRVLRQGNLVVSTRGALGGYRLSRPAEEIKVLDVVEALDGPIFPETFCGGFTGNHAACVHTTDCSIRVLWHHLGEALHDVLGTISIADLVTGAPSVPARRGAPVHVD